MVAILISTVTLGLPHFWVDRLELLLVVVYGRFIHPTGIPQLAGRTLT